MKINYLIPIVILIGIVVLFFFPNPESNFILYFGTGIFFVVLVGFLLIKSRK